MNTQPEPGRRCGQAAAVRRGAVRHRGARAAVRRGLCRLACRRIAEPHNERAYDLFIGEVVGAWADARWHFEAADPSWRSLHYVAGGQFYATGEALQDQSD